MIFSAVDGLSQGEIILGDLKTDMNSQMTFYTSPFYRLPNIKGWIASWDSEKNAVNQPEDWF